jgi:hypothetical protein
MLASFACACGFGRMGPRNGGLGKGGHRQGVTRAGKDAGIAKVGNGVESGKSDGSDRREDNVDWNVWSLNYVTLAHRDVIVILLTWNQFSNKMNEEIKKHAKKSSATL